MADNSLGNIERTSRKGNIKRSKIIEPHFACSAFSSPHLPHFHAWFLSPLLCCLNLSQGRPLRHVKRSQSLPRVLKHHHSALERCDHRRYVVSQPISPPLQEITATASVVSELTAPSLCDIATIDRSSRTPHRGLGVTSPHPLRRTIRHTTTLVAPLASSSRTQQHLWGDDTAPAPPARTPSNCFSATSPHLLCGPVPNPTCLVGRSRTGLVVLRSTSQPLCNLFASI